MIRRLYIHNFRCLENFELPISGKSSILLIGKNGSGKTTVALALEILQKIGRGTSRAADLVRSSDLARNRSDVPIRFEIEVDLEGSLYAYFLALEFSRGLRGLRVVEEKLTLDGEPVYIREFEQLYPKNETSALSRLNNPQPFLPIDWQLVALPIFDTDPVLVFKRWLSRILILRPIPKLMSGESKEGTLEPNPEVSNFGAWFRGIFAGSPAAYTLIEQYLKQVMPDFLDIQNPEVSRDTRSLSVNFFASNSTVQLPFEDLSDGEKCYLICAMVLATKRANDAAFCFWDEPDNYLALSEVGHFVLELRKAFQSGGQFIATSHNPETIRRFSDENTLVLYRNSHLEPTQVRPIGEFHYSGDLVGAITHGDLEP